jgi:hypothetical protein
VSNVKNRLESGIREQLTDEGKTTKPQGIALALLLDLLWSFAVLVVHTREDDTMVRLVDVHDVYRVC